jgi:hypothetical protein
MLSEIVKEDGVGDYLFCVPSLRFEKEKKLSVERDSIRQLGGCGMSKHATFGTGSPIRNTNGPESCDCQLCGCQI